MANEQPRILNPSALFAQYPLGGMTCKVGAMAPDGDNFISSGELNIPSGPAPHFTELSVPAASHPFVYPQQQRLQPWQLPPLNVNMTTSYDMDGDYCESFPSSATMSSCISQFTSPLLPAMYGQPYDADFAGQSNAESTFDTTAFAQPCSQLPMGMEWGLPPSAYNTGFNQECSMPISMYQTQTPINEAPRGMGEPHLHSLSAVDTSVQAPLVITSSLLHSVSCSSRSYSSPPQNLERCAVTPSMLVDHSGAASSVARYEAPKPLHLEASLTGAIAVDELLQIDEGETMDVILPPGSEMGSAISENWVPMPQAPVEYLKMQDQDYAQRHGVQAETFVGKLWRMMHHQPATTLIHWNEDGSKVVIPCQKAVRDPVAPSALTSLKLAKISELIVTLMAVLMIIVLPLYFGHGKFGLLTRQLTCHGFTKVKISPSDQTAKVSENMSSWEIYHPAFKRGHPELMEEINKRKASSGRRRAVSGVVNGSAVNDDLMKLQQENVEQRAQVNFLVIQLDEAKQRARGLQDSFESERGRANRLAMVSVTLMNICQTSFPDALESLPPHSEEDLAIMHDDVVPNNGGDYGESVQTARPVQALFSSPLHIVTDPSDDNSRIDSSVLNQLDSADHTSVTALRPAPGHDPIGPFDFGQMSRVMSMNRQLKRSKPDDFVDAAAYPSFQASRLTARARIRSYSASEGTVKLARTCPTPVLIKRPSQGHVQVDAVNT